MLPISIQMRILWTLAMATAFVVLVQYQTSGAWSLQQPAQGQPLARQEPVAEDLVTMALSKVVVNEDVQGVSRDLLTGITRQIARYVVYNAGCGVSSGRTYAASFSLSASAPVGQPATSVIYIITPTYRRPEQVAELTRLAQTLMLVRDIHWLVVEDSRVKSPQLSSLLQSFGISYEHLIGKSEIRQKKKNYRITRIIFSSRSVVTDPHAFVREFHSGCLVHFPFDIFHRSPL